MHVGATEVFRRDFFTGRGLHQGGPARKIVPLPLTMIDSSDIAST